MGTHLEFFFGGNFTGEPFVSAFIRGRQSQTYIDMCSILQDRQPPPRRAADRGIDRTLRPGATVPMVHGLLALAALAPRVQEAGCAARQGHSRTAELEGAWAGDAPSADA
jgi:hypothetical protein